MGFRESKPVLTAYFSKDADWDRLRSILSRNEHGSDQIVRTPFWHSGAPGPILRKWDQVLVRHADALPGDLYAVEQHNREKVGPMSITNPFSNPEKRAGVEAYWLNVEGFQNRVSEEAIERTLHDFSAIRGLRPLSFENTVDDMRLNTWSGADMSTTRADVVEYTLRLIRSGVYNWAAVLLHRGQEGGPEPEDEKDRPVMGFPFGANIQELCVYKPLIKATQTRLPTLVPGWVSNEMVDLQVTKLFDTGSSRDPVIGTDFASFDTHFNRGLQDTGQLILRGLFTPSDFMEWWFGSVFWYAFTLPLICTESVMYANDDSGWNHGMGSGSGATQGLETPTHRAMHHQYAIDQGTEINPNSQDLGDDSLVKGDDLTLDGIMDTCKRLGQEMNPDKQEVSTDHCVYLRRYHDVDYRVDGVMVGIYPTFRALGRLLFQERFHDPSWWNAEMVTLRALSIIENCEWHPLFEEFVDFVLEGDKYKLGLKIPGFFDRMEQIKAEAQSREPYFLGYNKTEQGSKPMRDWRVVRYLQEVA